MHDDMGYQGSLRELNHRFLELAACDAVFGEQLRALTRAQRARWGLLGQGCTDG